MKKLVILISIAFSLGLLSHFSAAHAQNITVKMNGVDPAKGPGDISGTYNGPEGKQYKIVADSGGVPNVTATDSSEDSIMMHNTVIIALHDGVSGHIEFEGEFTPDPSGNVNFEHKVSGTFLRNNPANAASGSTFTSSGWAIYLGNQNLIGTCSSPPCYTKYIPYVGDRRELDASADSGKLNFTASEPLTGITDARTMKGEFDFTMSKKDDKITLHQDTGVRVTSKARGGGAAAPMGAGGTTSQCCACIMCPEPTK